MTPPSQPDLAKNRCSKNRISVWLTAEEKAAITEAAKSHAMTASAYLRLLGLSYPVKKPLGS